MTIPYLKNLNWANWTRDERFFCAVLFEHARREPNAFARWVIEHARHPFKQTALSISTNGEWDLGYEVAFYRDYLWPTEQSARQRGYPFKRTFDLCLFGERAMIVIEAKVFERFTSRQNEVIARDRKLIRGLPDLESIDVKIVALASSRLNENEERLSVFDGLISWADVANRYDDPLLHRAENLHKMEKSELLASGDL